MTDDDSETHVRRKAAHHARQLFEVCATAITAFLFICFRFWLNSDGGEVSFGCKESTTDLAGWTSFACIGSVFTMMIIGTIRRSRTGKEAGIEGEQLEYLWRIGMQGASSGWRPLLLAVVAVGLLEGMHRLSCLM